MPLQKSVPVTATVAYSTGGEELWGKADQSQSGKITLAVVCLAIRGISEQDRGFPVKSSERRLGKLWEIGCHGAVDSLFPDRSRMTVLE